MGVSSKLPLSRILFTQIGEDKGGWDKDEIIIVVTTHAHRDAKLLPVFSTKQNHKFTKNTISPAILLKYYAYLCTKLISMEEYLIISNANFLLRVASEQIAYVCSEGSYCNLRLTNGDEYTFSFNLVVFEKKIVEQLAQTAHFFARVGRNYIINSQHIFSIDLNTSELVLYNERFCEKFTLHVSKEPLKQLKALLDNSIKS